MFNLKELACEDTWMALLITSDTLKDIIWDIDKLYYSGKNEVSQNLLYHLRNTMSDRAATEIKFNELLESYRAEILPQQVVGKWQEIPESLQTELIRLNNFFCGLHGLVHVAETCNKVLICDPLSRNGHVGSMTPN